MTASGDVSLRLRAGRWIQRVNSDLIPFWSKLHDGLRAADRHRVGGVADPWGRNVLVDNAEMLNCAPKSWSVVFDALTLPGGKLNRSRVQDPIRPIQNAEAALDLMARNPGLGIKNP